ncbi:MAG: GFA family protein [Gammaproteobacteria bacterium]
MSDFTLVPDEIKILENNESLALYQFDIKVAKHFFCKTCGIYPFHQTMRQAGNYRVNLGCIYEIDYNELQVDIFDGKSI